VEFGSGGITSLGVSGGGVAWLTLIGPRAHFETGATNSNSALTSLSTISSGSGKLQLLDGASVTTTVALTNAGRLLVDDSSNAGGSSLTLGGSLTNNLFGGIQIGSGQTSAASTLKVTGTLTNVGAGVPERDGQISVFGGQTAAGNSLLNVTGAAPGTLTGTYNVVGHVGSAAVEFGSGKVTGIGDGKFQIGSLTLNGPNAYFETGATNSNSALSSLSTIASNGRLQMENGASLSTTGALSNGGGLYVDGIGSGGSSLTIGGSLTNTSNPATFSTANIGVGGENAAASTLSVTGTLANTGGVYVTGGSTAAGKSLLNVTGAVPSTLTGTYGVQGGVGSQGSVGSAAVEFGSGKVASIGDGASNSGALSLNGPNAYFEIGATNSNSALTSLSTIASNGAFSLRSGASLTTTGALSNAGTLGVDGTLTLGGSLTNTNSIEVGRGNPYVVSTLNVRGTLANTSGDILVFGNAAGRSLLNVTGAAPSTLTGAYTVAATVASAAVEFGSGWVTRIGDGASNAGSLTLAGPNAYFETGATNSNSALKGLARIAANGQLNLEDGAAFTLNGALTNAGALSVDGPQPGVGGSSFVIKGALTNNGSVQIGNFDMSSTSTLTAASALTNGSTGNITLQAGNVAGGDAVLNVTGPTITNSGIINVYGSSVFNSVANATLQIGSNVTLSGTGTVTINSNNATRVMIRGTSPSLTFTNSSTIQGAGTISNMGIVNSGMLLAFGPLVILPSSAGLNNTGTLSVGTGATMQIGTSSGGALKNFSGTTLTGGTYLVGGTLQFGASGTSIVTNAANITLTGERSQIIDFGGGRILAHFASNTAAGTFTLAGNRSMNTSGGSFTNAGTFTINTGSTFTVGGPNLNFTQTGGTSTIDGTLTSTSTGKLSLNGGSLFGGGTLGYAVTDAATITPGDSSTKTGTLTVGSTYTQSAAGALDISIGGTAVGIQYDQLKVSSSASLGGTLNVSRIGGFIPTIGSTFAIVNAGSRSGTFGHVNGLSINSSEHFSISYTGTGAILTVVAGAAPVQSSANYGKTDARGIHMMIAAAPRRFRTADMQPAEQAIAPPIAPGRSLSPAGPRVMTGSPSPYGNAKRFECGVDVKELLKTSPKRVWKNWLIDPTEPSPVGYVTMTH
jgi:hypothetical protein